ncbi:MAG: M24 family metallopeptidase, partial [Spirochaetota bacterium]
GLQVHELPALRKGGDLTLVPGCVVTVEPGIYLPHRCGVRIEDMILVTEDGCEILTGFSKEIIIL